MASNCMQWIFAVDVINSDNLGSIKPTVSSEDWNSLKLEMCVDG